MLRRMDVRIGLIVLLAVLVGGTFLFGPTLADLASDESADPAELTVAAAANLIPAFEQIADAFEEQYNAEIDLTFGSTSQLAGQIESGAPIDVFASADTETIEHLDDANWLLSDTIQNYARGRIILWMPDHQELRIDSLEDLIRDDVRRIAIANPEHAPYGVAAREALQQAGLWDDLEPKIVPSQSVRAALQAAETGNVDVAIVALALAVETGNGYWSIIPGELHQPIDQAIAVTVRADHEDAARTFVEFVTGPEGRAILERFEYELPGGDGS